jgi:hypothetical protein
MVSSAHAAHTPLLDGAVLADVHARWLHGRDAQRLRPHTHDLDVSFG